MSDDAQRTETAWEASLLRDAWEQYVQTRWGGWTEYAKVHIQASGKADKDAFTAGWRAAREIDCDR